MTKGFSRPFSPKGTASLSPALPLNFAGDLTLIHFDADAKALATYLPAPLEPTGTGDAFLWTSRLNCHRPDQDPAGIDPARTFYNVCVIGIPALMNGKPTMFSAFQWADRDWLLGLSWFLGACSKMATIEETGRHPLYASLGSRATGDVGSSFTRTVSRNGSRVATVRVDTERSVPLNTLDFYFNRLPLTCMRHIPDVGVPPGKPVLHDLTHMIMSNVSFGEVREGAGELSFGDVDNEDLVPIRPVKVNRAYVASMAFVLEGAKTIHNYLEEQQTMVDIYKNGVGLWYETSGQGTPLVLIGGFALQDKQWEFCLKDLEKSHTIISWSHRGAGRSDWTMVERPSLEQYVEDLHAILDHAGIERAAIWGTSTGAPISIRFAAKYPERTSALITYPWLKSDADWRGILDTAYLTAKYFGVPAMSRLFAGAVIPEDLLYEREGTDYERWAKKVYADYVNPLTLREMLDAYSEIDLTGDVKRLQCPTMLLMGNDSAQNKKAEMESVGYDHLMSTFLALKEDVEIGAIEHAGSTYCMITRPEECARVAIDFLQRSGA